MKTVVHIIPHAHWDREWYLPLEIHRARLISHLDSVLELLEADPSYTYQAVVMTYPLIGNYGMMFEDNETMTFFFF